MIDDLYVKDANGKFIPIKVDILSVKDLEDKLMMVTVGSDAEPSTTEVLEYVHKRLISAGIIKEAMRKSKDANILIIPHIIKVELLTKKELDAKTLCVQVLKKDEVADFPEIQSIIRGLIRKDVVVLPAPVSLSEYKEIKAIKERIKIRKQRHGGGLNK